MNSLHRLPVLCFALLLAAISAVRADVITVSGDSPPLPLESHVDYVHDSEELLHPGHFTGVEQAPRWRRLAKKSRSLTMRPGLYWFRVTLENPTNSQHELLLQLKSTTLQNADLYRLDEQGQLDVLYHDLGLAAPFTARPLAHRDLLYPLQLPAHSRITLIWRAQLQPRFDFHAKLWDREAFATADQHTQLMNGMVYGSLLVMAAYNLFLFLSTRQRSYGYFVLYVLGACYLLAAGEGDLYQYFAADSAWPKSFLFNLVHVATLAMFCQFSIHFLQLKSRQPRLRQLMLGLLLAASLLLIGNFSGSRLSNLASMLIIQTLYLTALYAGVRARMAGSISAGNYVLAIVLLIIGLTANTLAGLGWIAASALTDNLPAIGTAAMLVFFSLALADRINQLQLETEDNTRDLTRANAEKQKALREMARLKQERLGLEQQVAQAQRESRAKSDFLATLSHEIRTPMNGVLGMAELLKDTDLDDQQTRYLTTIEHSGETLLTIIKNVQDFARFEAGISETECKSFNLETFLDDCISSFTLPACEKGIEFIADADPQLPPVLRGDAGKLRIVLDNLLSNAFKFTERGRIILRVGATDKPAINCIELRFEVSDTGIGLSKEQQERLFTPFQRASDDIYGRYGGSGLGLSICKQLVELMDGEIGVVSTAGQGASFWFTARLFPDTAPAADLLREKSALLRGKRVLLVEGHRDIADIIARQLQSWGIEVLCAENATQALSRVQSATSDSPTPDVALVDYQLDDGNGIAVIAQLRHAMSTGHCRFVLMASPRQINNRQALAEADITLLLEKPLTTALLHDSLRQATREAQQVSTTDSTTRERYRALTVLVVDDNQVNEMVITGLLKRWGIQPVQANGGLQALEASRSQHFDLILMDCEMPDMDGYEATHQLRAREQREAMPASHIVALSAHARSDHQQRAHIAGMDGYLTKPVTPGDLEKVLEESLQRRTVKTADA